MAVAAVVAALVAAAFVGYEVYGNLQTTSKPLLILSADSYVAESAYLGAGFANSTDGPYAAPTSAGSFALAQQIASGAPDDVFVSASISAIGPVYLKDFAPGWGIAFASDQMVIAYGGSTSPGVAQVLSTFIAAQASGLNSSYAQAFGNLSSGRVRVGIANPSADPAGFYAWIALEIAGALYSGNNQTYVQSMLHNSGNVTGAHAAALIAPLQLGQIQFLFLYKSAAISHGLGYISLPRQVNLGDPSLYKLYGRFTYTISSGPARGVPILVFMTVPKYATQPGLAYSFVAYVVQHTTSLKKYGLGTLSPAKLYNSTDVPPQVAQLISSGLLVPGGAL